jgi:hypothetical protein
MATLKERWRVLSGQQQRSCGCWAEKVKKSAWTIEQGGQLKNAWGLGRGTNTSTGREGSARLCARVGSGQG